MATTDLHMQVLPHNYQTGTTTNKRGFARTATLIRQARREVTNSILVDNGDFLCGTGGKFEAGAAFEACHPMISIMNHLGYDAATPGNHDFDHGLQYLTQATSKAAFPFVSANALIRRGQAPAKDVHLFSRFMILERQVTDLLGRRHVLRIGVTGFLPPNSIAQYETDTHQIQTRDILEAARAVIPQMKAAGADIIIALAHTGIGRDAHFDNMENAAVPLARMKGIDAIIAGHQHQVFPGPDWPESKMIDAKRGAVHGKPVVSSGFWGSHLGLIDLNLVFDNQAWRVKRHKCETRPIFDPDAQADNSPDVEPDQTVVRIMQPTHKRILNQITKPVGRIARPLNSFFALAAPSRAVQEIQRAQFWFAKKHLADYYNPALPVLSSACPFKSGGYGGAKNFTDIAAGTVTMRAILDLYPFPNQIALLPISGANLREWLERSASVFNAAMPGTGSRDLITAETPAYIFETVLGVEYRIDLSQEARYNQIGQITAPDNWRIKGLSYAGKPVAPDQVFTLITTNYRVGGGGYYPQSCLKGRLKVPVVELQKLLPAYFNAHPNLDPALDPHWQFASVPGARMRFRSSPRALKHLDDLTGQHIKPGSIDEDEFQHFELCL